MHDGKPVTLKGVNVGGWLMMEGYILHAPIRASWVFKKEFRRELGGQALREFEVGFQDTFIREQDFKRIAQWGCNCVRVPFNYRLLEKPDYKGGQDDIHYLDNVVKWAEKYQIWVILDLHAAWGSQNHDWHSDSTGDAELWTSHDNQNRTLHLWATIAKRYRDSLAVAGYDLLNESVISNPALLNSFYKKIIETIRRYDPHHILFIEGNNWARDVDCLEPFKDDNYALSIHFYDPIDFTFNFIPHMTYPLRFRFTKATLFNILQGYARLAHKRGRPVFVGEFGVNYRQGLYGEDIWLKNMLDCFKQFGFHWTYWTYKAVKNSVFPDGLMSYYDNPPWVNRMGPDTGWDCYAKHWQKDRKDIIKSWKTENFKENKRLTRILKAYLK